jgi:hypothetical protein
MAAGAILPPLFFERMHCEPCRFRAWRVREQLKHHQRNSTAGVISGPPATPSLPKEI